MASIDMQLKSIAVIGPNGSVATEVIKYLVQDPFFTSITLLRRHTSTRPQVTGERITTIEVDYESSASLVAALKGIDAIVCCVPGGAVQLPPQKLIIDAAIEAGVKFFFASEFISDAVGKEFLKFPKEFVGDRIGVRTYLMEQAEEGKIGWTSLNGGPFFDMWLMKGPAGFDIAERKVKIYGTGNNPSCWTPLPVAAVAVVRMLRNPAPILNRSIFIAGVKDVTQLKLLAALETVTGEKFEVEYVDIKPIKQAAFEALEKGDLKGAVRGMAMNSNFNEEDSVANFWTRAENSSVGVEVQEIEEAVRDAMKAYGVN